MKKNAASKIQLVQDDVPDHEVKDIDEGWDKYYLGAIKQYLEEK